MGGEIGKAADRNLTHLRMLNSSKGPAVQSLRAQVDKYRYHDYIKSVLEREPNLSLRQGEVKALITDDDNKVTGVETAVGLKYSAKCVVLACGVYLDSAIIIGDKIEERGPAGFPRASGLAASLSGLGFKLRRFKTGTPARVNFGSIDLKALEVQEGEDTPYSFSFGSDIIPDKKSAVCYLGYTGKKTHGIIEKNLKLSPKYSGLIHGAGARYCPSVEDKIVRFKDKERHPFFLEPEGEKTMEAYVQGLSTGLPANVQLELYRSIKGFERVEIMRDAYAIEYECIDPLELYPSLESKRYKGLFFAGQINGTSGYEEAAAQGLVAGVNAARFLKGEPPIILPRESSYIGVLIDDLTTKGTDEPYRMMTSKAEYRLLLRQDNADIRLSKFAAAAGLLSKERLKAVTLKMRDIEKCRSLLSFRLSFKKLNEYFLSIGEAAAAGGLTVEETIRRNNVTIQNFSLAFDVFKGLLPSAVYDVFVEVKYGGYIAREAASAAEARRTGDLKIPEGLDFLSLDGLRIEAREKLNAIKPLTVGQASRIAGVTPADVNALILRLSKR
jgi:tRNA uridine 5-carboxymethylaminomethyl modification enzyme